MTNKLMLAMKVRLVPVLGEGWGQFYFEGMAGKGPTPFMAVRSRLFQLISDLCSFLCCLNQGVKKEKQ